MIRNLLLLPKLIVLGYLAIVTNFFVRAIHASSLLVKALNLVCAILILMLPVWLVISLLHVPTPRAIQSPPPVPVTTIPLARPSQPIQKIQATVSAVQDGDSLDVQIDSTTSERVRLLGLDAPELGLCFGLQSAQGARDLLSGQTVWLEADTTLPNRDKFGRLSRYVRLMDGRLANQVLIEQGLAFEYTYFTAYDHQEPFRAAEAQAQRQLLGIWSDTACSTSVERPEHVVQTIAWQMPSNLTPANVTRIVDGDTIEVSLSGISERIRLMGIDTPEYGRCYAGEATIRQAALTTGQEVLLESDPSQDDRDRYGRLLRYIWLPDGRLVNAILVAEGYAYEYTYDLPYRYVEEFMQLEHEAHFRGLGLWAAVTCDGIAGRRYSNAYNLN